MLIFFKPLLISLFKTLDVLSRSYSSLVSPIQSITFNLEGNIGETGIVYYRIFDITKQVNDSVPTGIYDTKLKAYAHSNPIPNDIESNTSNPIYNLSSIGDRIVVGQIDKDEKNDEANSIYYRLDYGVYSSIDSSIYSDASMSLHMNVYSSQLGTISNELAVADISGEKFSVKRPDGGDYIAFANEMCYDNPNIILCGGDSMYAG